MNASRAAGSTRLIGRLLQPLTFLVLLFTGGSSWGHDYQLILVRLLAVALAVWGLASARLADFRRNPVLWLLFAALVALTISHFVPLPYGLWTGMGGRQIIADIDAAAGLGRISHLR
ncbi:hypothetical protein [Novosphingobium sp.]|uniref:hypothetical protein n=1 Tax=Novosphingobium sp. TaxID=1874826 RepID=UPI0022BAB567|nr:hypothetical protein [Novosphingobium sp.]MCZ8075256.1 hypothetical protein [Roseateles sp.]MCZ8085638.1 hypothetical protein [Paracoccaceae bacterium]MCZ8255796.1 hypothetical protein [Polaromonas sp.]MCZ8036405.1 hypothetical protein [Novosphingobium sp.]MCZ8233474.1 hypothetical protein [Novosphingobium sp.]